jgi:hypothetical protein
MSTPFSFLHDAFLAVSFVRDVAEKQGWNLWGRCAFWDKGPVDLSDLNRQKTLLEFG